MSAGTIITNTHTVPPSAYVKINFAHMASRYGWIAAIPISLTLIYGMYADWRWLVVAAAIIFIAIPVLLMFAWIHMLARPEVSEAIFPRKLIFDQNENRIRVVYEPLPSHDDSNPDSDEASPCPETRKPRVPDPRIITMENISDIEISGKCYVIHYSCENGKAIYIIPVSAFSSHEDISIFVNKFIPL